jgi:hypothetical protein
MTTFVLPAVGGAIVVGSGVGLITGTVGLVLGGSAFGSLLGGIVGYATSAKPTPKRSYLHSNVIKLHEYLIQLHLKFGNESEFRALCSVMEQF